MPSIRIGTTLRVDDAPTMPHMFASLRFDADRASLADRLRHHIGVTALVRLARPRSAARFDFGAKILVLALVSAVAFRKPGAIAFFRLRFENRVPACGQRLSGTAGAFLCDPLLLHAAVAFRLLLYATVGLRLHGVARCRRREAKQGGGAQPVPMRREIHFVSLAFFTGRFQPWTTTGPALATVNSPAGASFVIVLPAPIVAPLPTLTGATSTQFDPIDASSSITVRCLLAPS